MDKQVDLITIVVPIYNIEKYVEKCIESIIGQTYKNIEIILVDDGSKDNSGKICDEFATKDHRIKVIHKENGGLSDARNKGLEVARGKYIVFVDGDDYIEQDMIEDLYSNLKENNLKIAVCGAYRVIGNKKNFFKKTYNKKIFSKEEALIKIIDERNDFRVWAWNKMYDISLFKNIRYPLRKIYEDVGTTYKLIDLVDEVIYTGKQSYNYCDRADSITGIEIFNEKELNRIEMCEEMCDYIEKKYDKLKYYYEFFKITQYIAVINIMIKSNLYDFEIINKTRKLISKNLFHIIFLNVSMIKKIQILLFKINFKIYKKIYNIRKVN